MTRAIHVLHAPSPLGLKPQLEGRASGVRRAPQALRDAGLHNALGARFAGEVAPPPYVEEREAATSLRNVASIAAYSVALADATERLLDEGGLVLVLGGDCSILLGTALALRRRGRFGVVYIDAHPDYLTTAQTETGGVAGLPLALVTGLGPDVLANLEGRRPYIDEHDAMVVGSRDPFQVRASPDGGKRVEESSIRVLDLDEVRDRGAAALAGYVLERMQARGVDGVWVHLDVDVLDSAIMPAVDSPEPGGMSRDELVELLRELVVSPLVRGLQVTIYDPDRDSDGSAARLLVDLLSDALNRDP
ncbi:MAG TPA: arginase family protein [Longimicrobiales bacterium]|nr:arginase family protein [Longimicrobiales bacterium]